MSEETHVNATDAAKAVEQPVSEVPVASNVAEQSVSDVVEPQEPEPTKELFESVMSDANKALTTANLEDAIENLDKAAVMSIKLFGDFAPETYSPHYLFGKAMIDLANAEQLAIADILADEASRADMINEFKEDIKEFAGSLAQNFGETLGDDAVEDDEAGEGGDQPMETVAEEGQSEVAAEPEVITIDDNEEVKPVEAEKKDEVAADHTTPIVTEPEEDDEDSDSDEEEDAEGMQLAFDFLEYARLVCEKNATGENALLWLQRQKETLLLLAQIAIIDEHQDTAVEDLSQAYKIVEDNFPDQLRELAFIRMQLVHVYRSVGDAISAKAHVDAAIEKLEEFMKKIQADPSKESEVVEITGLLKELAEQKNQPQVVEDAKQSDSITQPSGATVNDEVKSLESPAVKRAAEGDVAGDESAIKKLKLDA